MLDGDGAAITANYDKPDRHTLSSTTPVALMLEDAQDVTGEGPGFDAIRTDHVVSGEFGRCLATPWPVLEGSVAELGFSGAVLALPLKTAHRPLGALVVHRYRAAWAFDADVADFLAAHLAAALVVELTPEQLERELTDDWATRAVVHQATGMIAAQLRVGAVDALVLLRARTYALGTTLAEVAVAVVEREIRFDESLQGGSDGVQPGTLSSQSRATSSVRSRTASGPSRSLNICLRWACCAPSRVCTGPWPNSGLTNDIGSAVARSVAFSW
jgi:hypothetical protein